MDGTLEEKMKNLYDIGYDGSYSAEFHAGRHEYAHVAIQLAKMRAVYTLRRTAATMAVRSGDPFAVQRLLGHVDLTMATRYVQDVSEQTDKVMDNSRKHFIGKEEVV